ncbi:MAG TPA: Rrf2 family transcriptional regulator [Spirochaetota bacterium]|nr:Rrf2 family transcriptional regulator [Spirochaetota bacterium]HPC42056.1 Rrf2 family transcriptional regulator [Spirochaetota bacterium]HPL18172.1 Rrf2 family transcriptional regulator [Spirochaetota bacterium]HQJ71637.1 Rrf2 family transcriptional regulator [Spirochaetota bacterium]HRS78372.1 Rrf2 family transcriptional regulator [Spirochaetota bacterium]
MSHGIRISDAASLAMHAMAVLASRNVRASARDISVRLSVSENHLAKVLQRLAKSGLITSTRGPRGGFSIAKKSGTITLLDVYEAIEGPLKDKACLMRKKTCNKKRCILGDSMETMWDIFRKHLNSTRISDISEAYGTEAAR